jgi:hypothetical protein
LTRPASTQPSTTGSRMTYRRPAARPFEHEEALLFARRDLARIDRNLTRHHSCPDLGGPDAMAMSTVLTVVSKLRRAMRPLAIDERRSTATRTRNGSNRDKPNRQQRGVETGCGTASVSTSLSAVGRTRAGPALARLFAHELSGVVSKRVIKSARAQV